MTELSLNASPRTGTRKAAARQLRREGFIPAVIYGLSDPVSIQINEHQLTLLVDQLHGGKRLISLNLTGGEGENGKEKNVLIKEIQTTPVGNKLLHVDFQEIDIKERVHVSVELHPIGSSVGVKLGGILQVVKHEIIIECLPTNIPEHIEADVSELDIGDSLHVKDLLIPEGITAITDQEETIIVISAPRVEEVEEEVEEEEEALEGELEEGEEASEEEKDKE